MKTITEKQPWGFLICAGIKDIENRTWPTKYRGKVLIHASAQPVKMINPNNVFTYQQWESLTTDQKLYLIGGKIQNSAIIGSVEIVDCVINHPSIWAEKTDIPSLGDVLEDIHYFGKALKPDNLIYNWVLANPVLFANPIPAKGKLSFWDYPLDLCHICGQPTQLTCERCGENYCDNHGAKYDQFTMVDYDCCSECYESLTHRE